MKFSGSALDQNGVKQRVRRDPEISFSKEVFVLENRNSGRGGIEFQSITYLFELSSLSPSRLQECQTFLAHRSPASK
jgi:hypothetical protein